MQERYIAPAIMLAAAAITSIFNIINQIDFFEGIQKLLINIFIFYIVGKIATKIIVKATKMESKKEGSEIIVSAEKKE